MYLTNNNLESMYSLFAADTAYSSPAQRGNLPSMYSVLQWRTITDTGPFDRPEKTLCLCPALPCQHVLELWPHLDSYAWCAVHCLSHCADLIQVIITRVLALHCRRAHLILTFTVMEKGKSALYGGRRKRVVPFLALFIALSLVSSLACQITAAEVSCFCRYSALKGHWSMCLARCGEPCYSTVQLWCSAWRDCWASVRGISQS